MAAYAARYARAFADVVGSARLDPEEVTRTLNDFAATLRESADLREVLENPTMAVETRLRVIDALATRLGLARPVRNFLAVILRQERMSDLPEILQAFHSEMDRRQGVKEAEIETARPLDRDERRALEQQVATLAGSRVRARFREDRSLIGGVIVRLGSTVYDGSVRGRLSRLKEELIAG